MLIDVVLTPAEIALLPERDLSGATCVVFDVLRATSSMITALAHGATELWPACSIEEARELRGQMPDALLGGERHGELIEGFDLGNSPLEYCNGVASRRIISTTTNGTIALRACAGADRVLVGAILNLETITQVVAAISPERLLIVCAGTFDSFALEDACAAGLLIAEIYPRLERASELMLSDSSQAALGVAKLFPDALTTLRTSRNGRVLLGKGRDAELEWCAQVSRYKVIGAMQSGVIRSLPI